MSLINHNDQSGMKCGVSETNLKMSLLMYSSYFVLFAKFFYNTYVGSGTGGKGKGKVSSAGEMIMKIEKKIQQQTDEIANASSIVSTQETKNNFEPEKPKTDIDPSGDIGKLNQANTVKNTSKQEENESKGNEKFLINQTGIGNTSDKEIDPLKLVHNLTEESTELKEEKRGLDDRKLDDNINATSTSQN